MANLANKHVKEMTRGNPYLLMLAFALPVFISQVFQQLYNAADSLIVGRFLGDDPLAAVSSSGPLIFLMISFFEGTSMGAGVTISRYFGARDHEKVSRAIHTTVTLSVISGLILTVAGVLLTPTLLRWMDTDPDVLPQAISYFRYYFAGAVAMVMYNTLKGIMNALGDSRRPLYYLILSSVTNVLLDLLFVGVFRWGVWAAALATTISQAASAVLCLIRLSKKDAAYPLQWKRLGLDREMVGLILRYGIPSGVQNSVIALANVIIQTNINSFGKIATAGFGVHSRIEGFGFLPITSFAMAISTFVSQNLGAGEYKRARQGARFGILSAVLLAELIGLTVYLFAPQLVGLFSDTPAVIASGTQQARIQALFYCLLAFSHAVAAVCRGAGKSLAPMVIMLLCWCAIRIGYITVIMRLIHQIQYIFWAYPLTWSLSSVLFLLYYLRSDWVHGFDAKLGKKS